MNEPVFISMWPLSKMMAPNPSYPKCAHFKDDAKGYTVSVKIGIGSEFVHYHECADCVTTRSKQPSDGIREFLNAARKCDEDE